jgi:hypothetical protein
MCSRAWIFNTTIFSIVKKRPLFVNFSISYSGKYLFSQCSISLVGMRFSIHVPNSPRDKSKNAYSKKYNPCLLKKVYSLAFKTLLTPIGIGEKTFASTLTPKISGPFW